MLEISDSVTLNALTRALVAAKFQLDPVDRDVPGSTLLAELANRVAETCAAVLVEEGRMSPERAERWREPSQHLHALECVRARIRECQPWGGWTADQRTGYVETLLAPYLPVTEVVSSLCDYGDDHHSAKAEP